MVGLLMAASFGCGESTENEDRSEDDPCAVRSIEAYCARTGVDCPPSSADVVLSCGGVVGSPAMTSSSETTCGSAITVVFGLSSQQYFFDREDRLIGVVETSDSG